IHRRDPSSLSVARTRPAGAVGAIIVSGPRRRGRSDGVHRPLGRLRIGRAGALERDYVRGDLVDLLGPEQATPGRHSLREHAFDDGLVDRAGRAAVDPGIVGKVRADHATAPDAVAGHAVLCEDLLSLVPRLAVVRE